MQEYLTTTSLGDLRRKSRDAGQSIFGGDQAINNTQNNESISGTNNANTINAGGERSSHIRPNIGEINQ